MHTMTTPPITRRCPFCGATTDCLSVKTKHANGWMKQYVHCDFCGTHGPWCSYDNALGSREAAIVACIFDWNYSDGITSWANEGKSKRHYAKRVAFIAKWTKPTTTTRTPTTTTKTNRKANPNHQPKGA